jgi:hypothetical protein
MLKKKNVIVKDTTRMPEHVYFGTCTTRMKNVIVKDTTRMHVDFGT